MADSVLGSVPAGEATQAAHVSPRHVAAAVVGNWLEFYDFVVYTYFALQIGDAFFPTHTAFGRLMFSLITFGVGFICRPIGAVVFGHFADHVGRRPAMLASYMLMGVALTGFVLTPSYAQIGMAAPVIAVICRLVQGFALGGEVGPTTAFLVEAAPFRQRGLYGAWQSGSQSLASITAGVAGLTTSAFLGATDMHDWGWRVALGVGALTLPFGLLIRRTLPETRHNEEPKLDVHPEHDETAGRVGALTSHWRVILLGLGIIAGGTISTYVSTYMTTFTQTTLHMSMRTGLMVAIANGVMGFIACLVGGALSDRIGRRPMMIWPRLVYLLMILPIFTVIVHVRQPPVLLGMIAILGIFGNLAGVPAMVAVVESLRKDVRGIATGTIYATAVAVFGGTTQPMVAWLEHVTGNHLAIAWYLMGGTAIALVSSALMTETVTRAPPASPGA